MSKQIQAVDVWVGGDVKVAKYISMISVNDNLETSATFYYQLHEETMDEQDQPVMGASLVAGNLTMNGQSYDDWGSQSGVDINTWAFQWAAEQLNLVIV